MPGRLELYTRTGCHLCTRMLDEARPIAERHGASIELVDIDDDPALAAHHNVRIPVLLLDGREICHHFLDAEALERALGAG
ncbi:MAG: glutaredoxin family protein [Halofilum sp. (in: g-proteobacteria)]|nr:glutaredoxin family protein [Halofilum sp. (in: g-proteobacteria)]